MSTRGFRGDAATFYTDLSLAFPLSPAAPSHPLLPSAARESDLSPTPPGSADPGTSGVWICGHRAFGACTSEH